MKRKFQIGTVTVEDPNPLSSLQDVFALLVARFPQVRFSSLLESDGEAVDAETVLYRIPLPPVKTNG